MLLLRLDEVAAWQELTSHELVPFELVVEEEVFELRAELARRTERWMGHRADADLVGVDTEV